MRSNRMIVAVTMILTCCLALNACVKDNKDITINKPIQKPQQTEQEPTVTIEENNVNKYTEEESNIKSELLDLINNWDGKTAIDTLSNKIKEIVN